MSDRCEVYWLPPGVRDFERIRREEPSLFLEIERAVSIVREQGWHLCANSEHIKVLRDAGRIGEIRIMGKNAHRLFFFWADATGGRDLFITHVRRKADIVGRRRLGDVLDAVAKIRDRYEEDD